MLLTASSASAQQKPRHVDEIRIFASTMAVAKTVKEGCPGIEVDDRLLEKLRGRLHVAESDLPSFALEARAAAGVLARARDEAPTRQAWCDAVFRLYGPDGKLMQGLVRR